MCAVTDLSRTCARQGLHCSDPPLLDGLGILSEGQLHREVVEGLHASHGKVLHVIRACDPGLCLPDNIQDDWLAVVITIGALQEPSIENVSHMSEQASLSATSPRRK